MNKKLLLAFYFLLSTFYLTNAQSWQWGRRGGSADAGPAGADETVVDIATDLDGNIYVLSKVMQTGLNVDGSPITGWGGYDILISSFKCDGTYRWSKDIGGNGDDYSAALKTDTLGGVYVCGNIVTHFVTVHVDADTVLIGGSSSKNMFIAKFDTAGTYKWFRMPQPDTAGITSISNTGAFDMDVDGSGNVYLFSLLAPGAYAGGGYVVTTQGYYILKFDNVGDFISGTPLQISYTGYYSNLKMKRDHQDGRYYITGNLAPTGGTLSFGGTPITHYMFVGCFNSSGTLLWQKQDVTGLGGGFARAAIDAVDNIYLTNSVADGDTFNTYGIVNTLSSIPVGIPFIVKLDTNGNNIWAKNGSGNDVNYSSAITLNGNEVVISGAYTGELKWTGFSDSLSQTAELYDIFITRFNSISGAVIGLDSLSSDAGYSEYATGMASDKFGNFYVGGDFASTLIVAGTTLNSAGGGSDFFVAKYGTSNCDTVHIPALEAPPGLPRGEELSVYPNPATEELNISGVVQNTSYSVFNITGIVIEKGVLHEGDNTVSMQNFASGVYILEMTGTDGERKVVRVVKE